MGLLSIKHFRWLYYFHRRPEELNRRQEEELLAQL
jgi:hypothetical protein